MKKIKVVMALLLSLVVAFSLTACGSPYSGVNTEEYIDIAKYKGLETKKIKVNVSDEDVEKEIQSRLEAKKEEVDVKEGVVENGDKLNIDYKGTINGKAFDGGTAEAQSLTIGSGQFIEGFESGLIGAKIGDTKKLNLTFPKEYGGSELAGKDVVFTVKINFKTVGKVPKLDDKFVQANSQKSKTVAEFKKEVRADLEKELMDEKIAAAKTTLWSTIVENSQMKQEGDKDKYPQEELDRVEKETHEFYESMAKSNGTELESFVKTNFGMDLDAFNNQIKTYAKIVVKEELVLYDIANKEGIEVSKDEYKQFIKDELARYGYTEETFEQANNGKTYEEVTGKDAVKTAALKAKVQDFIYKNSVVK